MTLLDDLRAADAAMTPGPWDRPELWSIDAWLGFMSTREDRAGIALMRGALPKLLAVVEAAAKSSYPLPPDVEAALAALEETP